MPLPAFFPLIQAGLQAATNNTARRDAFAQNVIAESLSGLPGRSSPGNFTNLLQNNSIGTLAQGAAGFSQNENEASQNDRINKQTAFNNMINKGFFDLQLKKYEDGKKQNKLASELGFNVSSANPSALKFNGLSGSNQGGADFLSLLRNGFGG